MPRAKKSKAGQALEAESAQALPQEKEAIQPQNPERKESGEDGGRVAELEAQVRQLMAQLEQKSRPQVVRISGDEEQVHFLWQAEVANDNVVTFGDQGMYGRIVGRTGSFYVPKRDLSRMLDERTRYFLDKRWLLVISGLSQEEREALGVDYTDGEVLDKGYFGKLVELGDEIFSLYPALCPSHRRMVAQRYWDAYQKGDSGVTRERVSRLNELSRAAGSEKGEFIRILEDMNAREVAGD